MEIYDPLRKKYVRQAPEEIVRQSVIKWLIEEKQFPSSHMMSEYSFTFNGLQYRSDIVVFDKSLNPIMFIECKAADIAIDSKVIDQCIRYNYVLKVKYILATNGKTSYLCKWNQEKQSYEMSNSFPDYQTMISAD